jgi:superoxide dismutase, Cu-Zn family
MLNKLRWIFAIICLPSVSFAFAEITVPMYTTIEKGNGKFVGNIKITETNNGLIFTPDLKGLKPGEHGFLIHELPVCDQKGMAAGGVLDPNKTGKHLGPYNNNGYLGDLPVLIVAADGTAKDPLLIPRIKKLDIIKNHSLIIYEGGDNYSDTPALGGGGAPMECGIIK